MIMGKEERKEEFNNKDIFCPCDWMNDSHFVLTVNDTKNCAEYWFIQNHWIVLASSLWLNYIKFFI